MSGVSRRLSSPTFIGRERERDQVREALQAAAGGQPAAVAGSRVTGVVRQAVDGSCTGASVDLTAGSTYKIAENDFMANGGDFYPNFVSRMTTQDIMDEVLADYITANTPISPAIQGRTTCVDGNGATAPNCPVVTP